MGVTLSQQYIDDQNYPIWPENVEAAQLFFACSRQWRILTGGTGKLIYQGLDYPAVSAIRTELEMAPDRQRHEKLQAIERGALEAMQQQ